MRRAFELLRRSWTPSSSDIPRLKCATEAIAYDNAVVLTPFEGEWDSMKQHEFDKQWKELIPLRTIPRIFAPFKALLKWIRIGEEWTDPKQRRLRIFR